MCVANSGSEAINFRRMMPQPTIPAPEILLHMADAKPNLNTDEIFLRLSLTKKLPGQLFSHTPAAIRTRNLGFRRASLYPFELLGLARIIHDGYSALRTRYLDQVRRNGLKTTDHLNGFQAFGLHFHIVGLLICDQTEQDLAVIRLLL